MNQNILRAGDLTLARQNYSSGIRFIHRPIPPGGQTPPPGSNSAEQNEGDQNNNQQAQTAARVIAPTPAVWPRRECAEQHQNEYNQ